MGGNRDGEKGGKFYGKVDLHLGIGGGEEDFYRRPEKFPRERQERFLSVDCSRGDGRCLSGIGMMR